MNFLLKISNFVINIKSNFSQSAMDGVSGGSASGSSSSALQPVVTAFENIMKKIVGPVIAVIGVAAVIYAIMLGVQYAKAEDAEGRKKVQGRLIGALIGAVIIVAATTLCFSLDWASIYNNFSQSVK